MRFSVPYNGDPSLPNHLVNAGLIEHVYEIYFAGNPTRIPSGRRPKIEHYIVPRKFTHAFDIQAYDKDLGLLINFCSKQSIKSNLLLNFSGNLTPPMINYVNMLVNSGVNSVTAGSTNIIRQVRSNFNSDLCLHNSVYVGAREIDDVRCLLNLGVNVVLVPPEMNHDFSELRNAHRIVREKGAQMKIMVNEGCIKHCPHRIHDQISAQEYSIKETLFDYVYNANKPRKLKQSCRRYFNVNGISQSNFIHPQDISEYAPYDPILKIVGRSFSSSVILRIIRSYLQNSYSGDLRYLVENFKHSSQRVCDSGLSKTSFL